MRRLRQLREIIFAGWGAALAPHLLLEEILGLHSTLVRVIVIVCGALGLLAGTLNASDVEEYTHTERRDVLLGWTAFLGASAAAICLAGAPRPYNWIGGGLLLIATLTALRAITQLIPAQAPTPATDRPRR